jgi:Fe-S cluster assembly protein SufA/iron-sulfur cluster assembly protein
MSVSTFDPSAPAVTVTQAALKFFQEKLHANNEHKILRLSTESSGCSGYAYVVDMVEAAQLDDAILTPNDGVTLAIDAKAINVLRGTEVDLVQEGLNRVVKFNNPNVVAECGQ